MGYWRILSKDLVYLHRKIDTMSKLREKLKYIITSSLPLRAFTMQDLDEGLDKIEALFVEEWKRMVKEAKPEKFSWDEPASIHNNCDDQYESNLTQKIEEVESNE